MNAADELQTKYGVKLTVGGAGVLQLDGNEAATKLERVHKAMDELCDAIEDLPPGIREPVQSLLAVHLQLPADDDVAS